MYTSTFLVYTYIKNSIIVKGQYNIQEIRKKKKKGLKKIYYTHALTDVL